jgi:hypothetical protein
LWTSEIRRSRQRTSNRLIYRPSDSRAAGSNWN